MKLILIAVVVAILAIGVSAGVFFLNSQAENKSPQITSEQAAPTQSEAGRALGPGTERSIDRAIAGKAENTTSQVAEAEKTGSWEVYKNNQGFEFSYPRTWLMAQSSAGTPDFTIYLKDPNNQAVDFFLILKNANQMDKNSVQNQCDINSQPPRCEVLGSSLTRVVIDWENSPNQALATVKNPANNMLAVFELKPTTPAARSAFREVLLTSKFN